ncbi:MAG TPA: hypothetical protein PKI20_05735 [Verrucomicrobiota bacterium]|nr:hypothetical protein [Verrucomicrobiota bacterium]HQL77136.1 hypothetical protein [Verrucomicrobiota bacterium]
MPPHRGQREKTLVIRWRGDYKRGGKASSGPEHEVNYYAHTAVKSDGTPDPDTAKWQLLSTHLRW